MPTTDDPSLPCLTFRFWVLGLGFSILTSTVSQLYYFKPQSASLSGVFILLITLFLGRLMSKVLPLGILNPGPFNLKEHVLITIMTNTASGGAYAIDILAVQNLYPYGKPPGPIASIALLLSSQLIGYGMAGMLRKWLVYPPHMIWPWSLPSVALFDTIHGDKEKTGKRIRLFVIVFAAIFFYGLCFYFFMLGP